MGPSERQLQKILVDLAAVSGAETTDYRNWIDDENRPNHRVGIARIQNDRVNRTENRVISLVKTTFKMLALVFFGIESWDRGSGQFPAEFAKIAEDKNTWKKILLRKYTVYYQNRMKIAFKHAKNLVVIRQNFKDQSRIFRIILLSSGIAGGVGFIASWNWLKIAGIASFSIAAIGFLVQYIRSSMMETRRTNELKTTIEELQTAAWRNQVHTSQLPNQLQNGAQVPLDTRIVFPIPPVQIPQSSQQQGTTSVLIDLGPLGAWQMQPLTRDSLQNSITTQKMGNTPRAV